MIINWYKRRTRVCLTTKIQYLAQEYSAEAAALTVGANAEKLDVQESVILLRADHKGEKLGAARLRAWAERTTAVALVAGEPGVQELVLVFNREDHFEKLYQSIKVASL